MDDDDYDFWSDFGYVMIMMIIHDYHNNNVHDVHANL